MILFFALLFIGAAAGLAWVSNTRRAKLERLAKLIHQPFEEERDYITTEQTAKQLDFFTAYKSHTFKNVFTFTDSSAFMRLADDDLHLPANPPLSVTLFSAELKHGGLPALKIAPTHSPLATARDIKPFPLTAHYTLFTPEPNKETILPKAILSLLQMHPNIYLEMNDNAFIYHEHTLIDPQELQTFRLRAIHLLQEILRATQKEKPTAPAAAQTTATQAEVMLAALTLPHPTEPSGGSSWRKIGFIALLAFLIGICLLAWTVLQRFVH